MSLQVQPAGGLNTRVTLCPVSYTHLDVYKRQGYASFDYELMGYQKSDLVKLDIMLNGEVVDALSFIIHAEKAYPRARKMAERCV